MLIFPIQNRVDWRNPPVATLFLLLLNTVIFFAYQYSDDERFEKAMTFYQQHNLLGIEMPLYEQYVEETGKEDFFDRDGSNQGAGDEKKLPEEAAANKENEANGENSGEIETAADMMAYVQSASALVMDREFDNWLRAHKNRADLPVEEFLEWQKNRVEFERLRNKVSSVRFGVTPAERKPYTFITSMFMHGDVQHLLGNMAFLFVFGFSLEIIFGRVMYVALYVFTGICADLLFIAFESTSYTPLIGASGAISGLMGMYIAAYGLRKINFFYSVIFYADYFKAPALIVFPVWILKEIYGAYYSDDQVAYWAHAGGLLSGFFLVLILKGRWIKLEYAYMDGDQQRQDLNKELAKLGDLVACLQLSQAEVECRRLLKRYPDELQVWQQYFVLAHLNTTKQTIHHAISALIDTVFAYPQLGSFLMQHLTQYQKQYADMPAITATNGSGLAKFLSNQLHHDLLDTVMKKILAEKNLPLSLADDLLIISQNLQKQGETRRAGYYRQVRVKLFPELVKSV